MSYLDAFGSAGIGVNWSTIAIGWDGPGKWPRLLTLEDVQTFASLALCAPQTANEANLVGIVAASSADIEDVTRKIHSLAIASRADVEHELRKWRVILLKEALWKIPRDPIYGLIALTEFWDKFNFPGDSPHIVQGRGDTTSPEDYYTEENYRRLLQRHASWVDFEVRRLGEQTGA